MKILKKKIFLQVLRKNAYLIETFLSFGYLLMFLSLIGENLQIAEKWKYKAFFKNRLVLSCLTLPSVKEENGLQTTSIILTVGKILYTARIKKGLRIMFKFSHNQCYPSPT